MDRADSRHQRQRRAGRLRRAHPAGRSGQRQTDHGRLSTCIAVSPVGRYIWGTVLGFPGYVIRLNPGQNPPATALAEVFEPPLPGIRSTRHGYPIAAASSGRPLSSGHMASFDRRKCKGPLNGPQATGQHCPEGWTLYPFPGPQLRSVTDSGSAEGELLHVGGSVRYARVGRGCAACHG